MLYVYSFCLLLVTNQIQLLVGPKINHNDQYSCSLPDDTDRDCFTLEKTGYLDIYHHIYVIPTCRTPQLPSLCTPTCSSTTLCHTSEQFNDLYSNRLHHLSEFCCVSDRWHFVVLSTVYG